MISCGAMSYAADTNAFTCVSAEWFILIGYTIALCPILIKVHTINKISRYARRFRRVNIDGKKLLRYPIFAMIPILLYLIVWTAVDRPTILDILSLDADDESVILVTQSCSSSSGVWILMSYLWQLLLLLVATILVFQSSDASEEMNEKQLGYLVYSQFVYLALRLVIILLTSSDITALGSNRSPILGIILSVDVTCSLAIFMGPKLYLCINDSTYVLSLRSSTMSFLSSFSSIRRSSMNQMMGGFVRNHRMSLKASRINDPMILKQNTARDIMKTLGIEVTEVEETQANMSSLKSLRRNGVSVIKPRAEVLAMLKEF